MNQEILINRAKKTVEKRKYSKRTHKLYMSWIENCLKFFETDNGHKTFEDESIQRFLGELKSKGKVCSVNIGPGIQCCNVFL